MRRFATLLLLLGMTGCAVPPPLSYPPAARERVVRLALDEWQDWGCATSGLPGPAVAACTPRGPALPEGDPRNFPRVLAYWRAVPQSAAAIPRNRTIYAASIGVGEAGGGGEAGSGGASGDGALWAQPFWSAAFISWLMVTAGVDAPEFAPDAAHAFYLDHLDALATAHPTLAPFLPRDPATHAPAPGDLVCFDRSRQPLRRWADRAAERGQFRPMHCDLVVATAPGVVEAVGGNVTDRVTLVRLPADAAGRLLPNPRPHLVVMENRLGRTPPWDRGMAVALMQR